MAGRLLAFGSVLGLAAAGGGWGAVSWGWAALALCWAGGLALVLEPRLPSRPQLLLLGGLAAFTAWTALSAVWSRSVPATALEVERDLVYLAGLAAAALLFRRGAEDGVLAAAVVVCAWNLAWRLHGYEDVTGASAEPVGYANGLALLAAIGSVLALRRPWTWPALGLTVPVLALAGSDGAWLGLGVGLVVGRLPRLAPLAAVLAAVVVLAGLHGHQRSIYWDVATADARANPALGSGAGTYRQEWLLRRPAPLEARDAHSLELEVLAELGPVGLLLLAGTLSLPFLLGRGGAALGAYAAWVVGAGVDWQWELPAVSLAGLLCGLAALPPSVESSRAAVRGAGLAALGAVAALALVGLAGNAATASAQDALRRGDTAKALAAGAAGAALGSLGGRAVAARVRGTRRRPGRAARGARPRPARLAALGRAARRGHGPRAAAGGRDGRPPEPARPGSA